MIGVCGRLLLFSAQHFRDGVDVHCTALYLR